MVGAVTLYGIPNCDQVRRARAWLDARGVDYRLHDFRRDGLSPALAGRFLAQAGAALLINRKGTTWKKLSEAQRAAAEAAPLELVCAQPSLVKRPVLEAGGRIHVGFADDAWSPLFP